MKFKFEFSAGCDKVHTVFQEAEDYDKAASWFDSEVFDRQHEPDVRHRLACFDVEGGSELRVDSAAIRWVRMTQIQGEWDVK